MQLSINLIKKDFLVLFILLIINEGILLITIVTTQYMPFRKSQEQIYSMTCHNLIEIANSFHEILLRETQGYYIDLQTLHSNAKIMKNTNKKIGKKKTVLFNKKSKFYKSYNKNNCLEEEKTFKTSPTSVYHDYINTDAISDNNFSIRDYLFNKRQNNQLDKEEYISSLLKEKGLNRMSYVLSLSMEIKKRRQIGLCYIMSTLKSFVVRDLVFNRYPSFYYIYGNIYDVFFPLEIYFDENINLSQRKKNLLNFRRLQTDDQDFFAYNGKEYPNSVYIAIERDYQFNFMMMCIKLPLFSSKHIVCTYLLFPEWKNEIKQFNHYASYALISYYQQTELEVIFLPENEYNILSKAFSNPIFNEYEIKDQSAFQVQLFHLFYYHLFDNNKSPSETFVGMIISEYKRNYQIILNTLLAFKDQIKDQDKIDVSPFIFNFTQTYTQYYYNESGDHNHKEQYFVDTFNYIITPLAINTTIEAENTNRFQYFSIIITRNEVTKKREEIIHLNGSLSLSYFFFALVIQLFFHILLFIAFEEFIIYLMSPIVKYKNDLLDFFNRLKVRLFSYYLNRKVLQSLNLILQ